MNIDLQAHLHALGFHPVRRYSYVARGGAVLIATDHDMQIVIGGRDFCITDLFVLFKNAGGAEGMDFRLRNETLNWDYSNRISSIDTGATDRPKIPYQTMPGSSSLFKLPFIVNARDVLTMHGFARYVGSAYFDVILSGYELNTVGAKIPYLPKWYHFWGEQPDWLAATTYGIEQEVNVSGPSDFLCFCISSSWDRGAGIDVRETLENRKTAERFTKRIMVDSLPFPRPYDTVQEVVFPVPFKIPSGSALRRSVSNYGAVAARRPELTLFGYYDMRER